MIAVSGRTSPRHDWIWLICYGIIVFIIGIVALLNPFAAGLSLGIMLGITLLTYGSLTIVAGFSRRKTDWLEAVLGLMAVLAGGLTLAAPLTGTVTLVWMTGAWLLVTGTFSVIAGLRPRTGRGWLPLSGALNILLGGYLLSVDPVLALAYAAFMLGVSLIARSIVLIIAAIDQRKALR